MFENFTNTDMDILEEPISDLEAKRIKRLIAKKSVKSSGAERRGWSWLCWHVALC